MRVSSHHFGPSLWRFRVSGVQGFKVLRLGLTRNRVTEKQLPFRKSNPPLDLPWSQNRYTIVANAIARLPRQLAAQKAMLTPKWGGAGADRGSKSLTRYIPTS